MGVIERINKGEVQCRFTSTKTIGNDDGTINVITTYHNEIEGELLRLAKLGQQMQWVSVKDRLPNDSQIVDIWTVDGFREVGVVWHEKESRFSHTINVNDVTHWMPLPEPPKEAE